MILSAPAGGADAAESVASPANFMACVSVAEPTARLACYDAAAARITTAPPVPASAAAPPPSTEGPPRVPAVSPAEARFGDTGQLRGDAEARRSLPSKLEAYVTKVASLPNGRYLLTLDNNQVWQTTEANWAVEFNPEDAVTISRLPLGGYQIAVAGANRTLGVKRTQ